MASFSAGFRSKRRIRIAAALSVLFHIGLLAIPGRDRIPEQILMGGETPPMSVVIVEAPSKLPPATSPVVPAPEPSPVPVPLPPRRPRAEPRSTAPAPPATPKAVPAPEPLPSRVPDRTTPPMDMAALIEARRAQRHTSEANALANAERRDVGPQVADASAKQAIERNLGSLSQGSEGTSGVFQILRKGERTAEFAFNGWRPDSQRRWREVIEVDAGPGGDVELAIIRRMISLIREHYTGDFNWQSYKLGKVMVLSARPEDNATLEDFMSREFFGTPVIKRGR